MSIDLTSNCNDVLTHSKTIAKEFSHAYITGEHVFISLLDKSKTIKNIFDTIKIDINTVKKLIVQAIVEKLPKEKTPEGPSYSPKLSKIITLAGIAAKKQNSPVVGTLHLLLGLLETGGLITDTLELNGIDPESIQRAIWLDLGLQLEDELDQMPDDMEFAGMEEPAATYSKKRQPAVKSTNYLNSFAVELTSKILKDQIDPVIGRNNETDQVIQILLRRQKNNPLIIGDAGVGKTAIVEGLAWRIVLGDVPEKLVNKKIYAIDMGSVLAGTKYRGQFEERLKNIIKELSGRNDCIAFIDEFHTVIGSGNSEGSLDACNILKPALSRGEITLIGATTYDEYKLNIESDSALTRRFQNVDIDEPTHVETLEILKGIKDKYESHHNVKYRINALKSIVSLTDRYITDRYFPDKAIDIMDQVAAKSRAQLLSSYAFDPALENEITVCERKKEKFIKDKNFVKAAECRKIQKALVREYETNFKIYEKKLNKTMHIGTAEVENLISQITNIPCERLDNDSLSKLQKMQSVLQKKVIGQDKAIKLIGNSVKRSRVGLSDENNPVGTFLFLGPTGVGKTHLAKQLCEFLFGTDDKMIRLDMSEYMEAHSVSKLIGSPPGYIGYGEGGKLTEAVKREPYSVILFDEIEKAHEDVYNILLQLLDEGKLTDSNSRTINFKNCIIIMTSNIGANKLQKNDTMGFLGTEYNDIESKIMQEVEKTFKPEFINRLDEIVIFNHLDKNALVKIINQLVTELRKRLRQKQITLNLTDEVKEFLIEKGYDSKYGARPLKRAIKTYLECALADYIIDNNLTKKHNINVDVKDDEIVLSSDSTEERSSNGT
jgi:ATP-dependent Clp protease ATP-binding subunit ClpC